MDSLAQHLTKKTPYGGYTNISGRKIRPQVDDSKTATRRQHRTRQNANS